MTPSMNSCITCTCMCFRQKRSKDEHSSLPQRLCGLHTLVWVSRSACTAEDCLKTPDQEKSLCACLDEENGGKRDEGRNTEDFPFGSCPTGFRMWSRASRYKNGLTASHRKCNVFLFFHRQRDSLQTVYGDMPHSGLK